MPRSIALFGPKLHEPGLSTRLGARPLDHLLPALILIGGSLNGLAARIVEVISVEGFTSLLPGVSPFEALAIVAGAKLMLAGEDSSRATARSPWLAHTLALAAILLPSSTVSWTATALYALWVAWTSTCDARRGALLFGALAVSAIWAMIVTRWLVLPITTAEATITAVLHGLLGTEMAQVGNVVGVPGGHALVVLAQCSSLEGLPRALVGLVAIVTLAGGCSTRRLAMAAGCAALCYVLGNTIRLVLMASSAELHAIVHGTAESNVYDLMQTVAVIGIGMMAARR
jgi:hypothetical protein